MMQVIYSTEKILGPHGELIRAKRTDDRIVLYLDAISEDYDNLSEGIRQYLKCFQRYSEDQPRDPDGKWTDGGGGSSSDGGDGGHSGGDSSVGPVPVNGADAHPGISSKLDIHPGEPMSSQSGIVTVNDFQGHLTNTELLINPTAGTVKNFIRDNGAARVLQDRARNIFLWPSVVTYHAYMMDALEHVETMWASDAFIIQDGKVVSGESPGTDKAKEWIERGQQNNKNADVISVGFVSPNVKSDLDFKSAVAELKSPQQASLLAASAAIDRAVIGEAKETSIIGAWADGAENSVMMTAKSDLDHLTLATVMKGYLADQKSVLVFQQSRDGDDVLARFTANGTLEEIHQSLLADGVAFHTLVPIKGGAIVYVADTDGSMLEKVKESAKNHDSKVIFQTGKAQFIGDTSGQGSDREQRDRARAIFERSIKESPVSGSDRIWAGIRDRWGKAAQKSVRRAIAETLYVNRPLLNTAKLIAWAKAQGFIKTITPEDMHVTIAFSRAPVDLDRVSMADPGVDVSGGDRSVERLGAGDAVVLRFESSVLADRWAEFIAAGASWDWPGYKPHITISFDAPNIDVATVIPYDDELIFGAEISAPLNEDWKSTVVERYSEDQPRDEDGKWTDGGGGSGGGGSGNTGGGAGGGSTYEPPAPTVENYKKGERTPPAGDFAQAKSAKQEWAAASPVTSMEAAKRLAPEGQKMLTGVGKNIEAKIPGVKVVYSNHKFGHGEARGEARVQEKADERKDRGGIAAVSDLARIAFEVDKPEKADLIFSELGKHFDTVSEPWRMTDMNYADRAANVRLPNGVIAEVQVMNDEMQAAKHDMHKNYEVTRKPGAVEKDRIAYDNAVAAQRETYAIVVANSIPAWRKVYANAVKVKAWLQRRLLGVAAHRQIHQGMFSHRQIEPR